MADKEVNGLLPISALQGADLLPVYDDSEPGIEKLKHITYTNMLTGLNSDLRISNLYFGGNNYCSIDATYQSLGYVAGGEFLRFYVGDGENLPTFDVYLQNNQVFHAQNGITRISTGVQPQDDFISIEDGAQKIEARVGNVSILYSILNPAAPNDTVMRWGSTSDHLAIWSVNGEMTASLGGTQIFRATSEGLELGPVGSTLLLPLNGNPEGVVSAPVGSLCLRKDGGVGTTLYVKESGTGSTGWAAK